MYRLGSRDPVPIDRTVIFMPSIFPDLPVKIHFDLSSFSVISAWLFEVGKYIFELLQFDFFGYTLNGWAILIGVAIVLMVVNFIARILQ